MADDEHQVPPDVTASGERVKSRSYEDSFAHMPRTEVHSRTGPGGGPQGPVAAGPVNKAMVVMAVGAVLAFSVFFVNTAVLLVLGLLLILVGMGMSIVRKTRPGRRSGLGTSEVADSRPA